MMEINVTCLNKTANQIPEKSNPLLKMLDIFEPDKQIVVLVREIDQEIEFYLKNAADQMGEGFRVSLKVNQPFPIAMLPEKAGRNCLARDLENLIRIYSDLLGCKTVGLRLEVVKTAMCPRFHVDHTGIRLLCTYYGHGTEWLEDSCADRRKLGSASAGICDEESGIILNISGIHQVPPFAIALLKGSRWQGNAGRGIIHRSPHVPESTIPRVLMALDALW